MTDKFNLEAAQRGEAVQYQTQGVWYEVLSIHKGKDGSLIIEYRISGDITNLTYSATTSLRMKQKPVAMMRLSNGMTYPKPDDCGDYCVMFDERKMQFVTVNFTYASARPLYGFYYKENVDASKCTDALNAAIKAVEVTE